MRLGAAIRRTGSDARSSGTGSSRTLLGAAHFEATRLLLSLTQLLLLTQVMIERDFGAIALAIAVGALVAPLATAGQEHRALRAPESGDKPDRSLGQGLWFALVVSCLLGLGGVVIFPLEFVAIAIAEMLGLSTARLGVGYCQIHGPRHYKALTFRLALWRLTPLVAILVSPSIDVWAASTLASAAAMTVSQLAPRLWDPRRDLSGALRTFRPSELRTGARYSLIALTASAQDSVDRIAIGLVGTLPMVATYAIAFRVVGLGSSLIRIYVTATYAKYFGLGPRRRRSYWRQQRPQLLAVGTLAACATFPFAFLAPLILPDDYQLSSMLVVALLASLPIRAMQYAPANALVAQGRPMARVASHAVAAIANFGLNLVLIPTLGLGGAAASTLICELVALIALNTCASNEATSISRVETRLHANA